MGRIGGGPKNCGVAQLISDMSRIITIRRYFFSAIAFSF